MLAKDERTSSSVLQGSVLWLMNSALGFFVVGVGPLSALEWALFVSGTAQFPTSLVSGTSLCVAGVRVGCLVRFLGAGCAFGSWARLAGALFVRTSPSAASLDFNFGFLCAGALATFNGAWSQYPRRSLHPHCSLGPSLVVATPLF